MADESPDVEVASSSGGAMLGGLVVAFAGVLEASAGRRKALKGLVTDHGGRVVYVPSARQRVTHLVVGEEDVEAMLRRHRQHQDVEVDSRVRKAQEAGVHVVSDRWLLESVAARALLDDIPYSYSWKQRMLQQGLSVHTRPEDYILGRLTAGLRDVQALGRAVDTDVAVTRRSKEQARMKAKPSQPAKDAWKVSLQAKQKQLMTERRLAIERKQREEKERKRQEEERARQRERESQQDEKRFLHERSKERRDEERARKLERLGANWSVERERIEARAREKRKEKVIRMLLWEQSKIEERTKELADIKRAQDSKEARLALWEEWEDKKARWRQQEAFELDRKIFVGGFKFDDAADEGETKARFIVEKRKGHLRDLLASFGPVLALRERWDKGYVFVLYKEPEDAARAFEALYDSEKRKSLVEAIHGRLLFGGQPLAYAPSSSFYVRWPRQKYTLRRGPKQPQNAPARTEHERRQQQLAQEREAKRAEDEARRKEAKERRKAERKEISKRERLERKEKRKSENRARVEQMRAAGEDFATIGKRLKQIKRKESKERRQAKQAGDAQTKAKTATTMKTKAKGKREAGKTDAHHKPKNNPTHKQKDKSKDKIKERKKTKAGATDKKKESVKENEDKKATTTTTEAVNPAPSAEPTMTRRERREKAVAELQTKTLEELEDALDVLQCGRRELIRGWRRGWETPAETRRWQLHLFEMEKKKRRLQRQAEKLKLKRDEAAQRRQAKIDERKRKWREIAAQEDQERQQYMLDARKRLEESRARELKRLRDAKHEAKRLRIERETAEVARKIARARATLRLQKNRRRRMKKREEARTAARKEAARLTALRRLDEEQRGPAPAAAAIAAKVVQPRRGASANARRRDDTWLIIAFVLLCALVFACAVYV